MPRRSPKSAPAPSEPLRPALLVSYVYLRPFLRWQPKLVYRDWVMDSGAFSAHNSGTRIDLREFIETCREMLANDPTLTEVFALDVIGDWKASLRNCERMHEAGVPAIPCYHVGEPEDALRVIARDYDKIALGGAVTKNGGPGKLNWAKKCFSKVWPKKIHGFGFGGEKAIMALPWHSVDSTSWFITPHRYGAWRSLSYKTRQGLKCKVRNMKSEVDWYLRLERLWHHKWRQTMQILGEERGSMRFALAGSYFETFAA